MSNTITIQRALGKLKLLDKQITKTINNSVFSDVVIGTKSVSPVKFTGKEDFKSISDLIKNRSELRSKIMISNSITNVVINGETMTVMDAIEVKATMAYKQLLLTSMVNDFERTTDVIARQDRIVQSAVENMTASFLSTDTANASEDFKSVIKQYEDKNKAKYNPDFNTELEIKKLSEYITAFLSEIDITLSESNIKTTIEI